MAKATGKNPFSKECMAAIAKALQKKKTKDAAVAAGKASKDEQTKESNASLEKYMGQAIAVVEEEAGKEKYGKTGDVKAIIKDKDEWVLKILGPAGSFLVKAEFVQRIEKKTKVAQQNKRKLQGSFDSCGLKL